MTLLTEPTRIVLAKVSQPLDADAQAYVNAVEVADGQRIEDPVRFAINNFVIGCKADGIWTAIKASCILAGARTLAGALVPLVGAAPTNNGPFVAGDYNRKTGLVGNGSTKYLDSNRNNNADPQNSKHATVYASSFPATGGTFKDLIGSQGISLGDTIMNRNGADTSFVAMCNSGSLSPGISVSRASGLFGMSRSLSSGFMFRTPGASTTVTSVSAAPTGSSLLIGARTASTGVFNGSYSFYSIGESLNLELLDARVTALINAFAAAIP